MSNAAALLVVKELSRHYDGGTVQALEGVTFDAMAGEVIALTGPSGCGKSTLLSLLGLLDSPTGGSVWIAGRDISRIRQPCDFRARFIGFVFQFHHMVPAMTLQENVAAPLIALGLSRSARLERSRVMLEQMNLSARAKFLPANVSGGERQRAAVARAMINGPPIILADEPTGNLDSHNSKIVIELLLTHARKNNALVLIATHNPEIAHAADRRVELHDGRVVTIR